MTGVQWAARCGGLGSDAGADCEGWYRPYADNLQCVRRCDMHRSFTWPLSGKCALLAAAASLTLAGCSYGYPLDVEFYEGKVSFVANRHGSGCLSYLEVRSESGEVMWHFERPLPHLDCGIDFPLIYGKLPSGTTSSAPAKPLQENIRYNVEASDGDWYSGSFRIRRVLKIESDPNDGAHGHIF